MNFYVRDIKGKKPSHFKFNLGRTIVATSLHENPHAFLYAS